MLSLRLIEANSVGQKLSNPITAAIRCAVLRRNLDALLQSLEACKELGGVVVLEFVESGRKCADIKIALYWNLLEHALTRRNVNGNAQCLALLCSGIANEEASGQCFQSRRHRANQRADTGGDRTLEESTLGMDWFASSVAKGAASYI